MPNDAWQTPNWLYALLNAEYGPFDFDAAAATLADAKTPLFVGPLRDSLTVPWTLFGGRRVWCNPPYSRGMLVKFTAKAASEIVRPFGPDVIVMLLPYDPSVTWWKIVADTADEIYSVAERVAFVDAAGRTIGGNTKPSAVAIWRRRDAEFAAPQRHGIITRSQDNGR